MPQSYFCAQQKLSSQDPRKPEPKLLTSTNFHVMSSFNDSGCKDSGDICNIFDFDQDDDVVGQMQSEWDKDTSLQRRYRNLRPSWPTAIYPYITQTSSRTLLVSQERLQLPFYAAWSRHVFCPCKLFGSIWDSIILQWVIYWFKIPGFNGRLIERYHVPFDGFCFDGKEWLTNKIRTHSLCLRGLQ